LLEFSSDVPMLTISPGERAGVRASVNAISTKNIEKLEVKNMFYQTQFNFVPFCG
jgi:hypothetical protein